MKIFALFLIGFLSLWGLDVGNGKSLIIPVSSTQGILEFNERTYPILPHPTHPDQGIVILPIDYYMHPQSLQAIWKAPDTSHFIDINISTIEYPIETLSVDPSKVCPPLELQTRIEAEQQEAEDIYNRYTPIRYWDKPFIRPIDSITTSAYGSSRTYNGMLRSYHGGVDFRALTPLPIIASNDGVVVLVKERYYSGGTVIIDHGEGLYTCYFHLSEYKVNAGEKVARGQEIALSGATGRITGPHLHFGVMIHGIQSDPIDLLSQINRLFDPTLSF